MPPLPIQGLKDASPKQDESGGTISVPTHDIYQDASKGPFNCQNCEHFTAPNQCDQPYIVQLRGPIVEPLACCDLFDSLRGK